MSNTKLHAFKLAALPAVAALLLGSIAANAAIEGSIKSNLSQFGEPARLKMERVGGQWRLKDGTVAVPLTFSTEVSGPQRYLLAIDVQVQHMAKGDGALYGLRRDLEPEDTASGNANLNLAKAHLLPMEKVGKDVCASHNAPGTKTTATTIPLTMWVHWHNGSVGYSVGTQNTPIYGNMPAVIECGPNPVSRPGGVAQEQTDFRVKSIALNYGGVPGKTKPNAATECKQARLTVTFNTSKAGVVDFRLHKKIGNGPTQSRNLQTYAKFDGNAHFVASYQEIVSVTKTDLVQAAAEDRVNPIGLTTGWKDVTLRCEDIGGGFAGTPGNANPDGLPQAPKQPKRVFDGPGNFSTGKPKPTHSTFKPAIAPALIKTAPAPQSQQRTTKHLGRLSFGVEREMKESGEK
jgi:hypothetical protein